jgi:aminoglycoside/choline kinase family phosphotransferase
MSDFRARLNNFLSREGNTREVKQLTPDASTREYFRIYWNGKSAIACVYPEPFVAAEQNYLDVTSLFANNGLPVAEVYGFDESLGIIIQEDLGDTILRDVLEKKDQNRREEMIDEAISLIARIQLATADAFKANSIASRLKFDVEKLLWELNFFREHYFETLKGKRLSDGENQALDEEFLELCRALESRAQVLCHRDFHAANLMIDPAGRLRIIDHQDARIGTPSYDLVSLLLDRVIELPSAEWLAAKRTSLIDGRIELGLPSLDEADFSYEFQLQTIQRCLKATGTFSFQSANRGKVYFLPFIGPMFQIVLSATENLGRFPVLQEVVRGELSVSQTKL